MIRAIQNATLHRAPHKSRLTCRLPFSGAAQVLRCAIVVPLLADSNMRDNSPIRLGLQALSQRPLGWYQVLSRVSSFALTVSSSLTQDFPIHSSCKRNNALKALTDQSVLSPPRSNPRWAPAGKSTFWPFWPFWFPIATQNGVLSDSRGPAY